MNQVGFYEQVASGLGNLQAVAAVQFCIRRFEEGCTTFERQMRSFYLRYLLGRAGEGKKDSMN
jgi:hypothetical protein